MPSASLKILERADGSATYSNNGYSIIGAVNGPVEVQRRDEIPDEAAIDVVIRPAAGVGGVRERHLESIIHDTLRRVILVSAHPRTLIQVTLQIMATPQTDSASGKLPQAAANLPILPVLLQTSILALLSTSIPLTMTLTTTLIAVGPDGALYPDPDPKQCQAASSVHVLAFSSKGDLLLVESQGEFSFHIWENVFAEAHRVCRGASNANEDDGDVSMNTEDASHLEDFIRDVVESKITKDQQWKESIIR